MKFKVKYYWLLLLIPAVFISWFYAAQKENKPLRFLPVYGPKKNVSALDSNYHRVPNFELTDQDGQKVSQATLSGSIYVTEFFFTTCKSICPIMNNNLIKVYNAFKNKPGFLILSHTVDPETDSVHVLKTYANNHGVADKKWLFATGTKKQLYQMARKGYLLSNDKGNGDENDFVHTQNFALVDKEHHLRGFYDGTDSVEIERLMRDIHLLLNEYEYKATIAGR